MIQGIHVAVVSLEHSFLCHKPTVSNYNTVPDKGFFRPRGNGGTNPKWWCQPIISSSYFNCLKMKNWTKKRVSPIIWQCVSLGYVKPCKGACIVLVYLARGSYSNQHHRNNFTRVVTITYFLITLNTRLRSAIITFHYDLIIPSEINNHVRFSICLKKHL